MIEGHKLTDGELAEIRNWSKSDALFGIDDLAEIQVAQLLDHIDGITAEHAAAMTRAREDADRVGAARVAFEEGQTERVIVLEKCIAAIMKVCERARGSQQIGQILVADMVEAAIQKANGPG